MGTDIGSPDGGGAAGIGFAAVVVVRRGRAIGTRAARVGGSGAAAMGPSRSFLAVSMRARRPSAG
jgi:hypothetical protein